MHLDELYRAVWDNPDDDATKLVLADALLAAGDPRGELIQLQISGHDEQAARRLLQRHGMTWLGALRGKVIPLAYEKGFLASCLVTDIEGAAGCGEWGTVHTVQLQEVAHLALLDEMRGLRAVIHAEPEVLTKLLLLPVARRLVLVTATDASALVSHHTELAALPALRAAEAPSLRLSRDAHGKLSHLAARWSRQLAERFELMPADSITTATITEVPRSQGEAVQEALMHFAGLAAEIRPMDPDEDRWWQANHERLVREGLEEPD